MFNGDRGDIMSAVVNNIETFRKMQHLSVQDVCEDLNMEPTEYRRYTQETDLTAETAVLFARYFVCTVQQLISTKPLDIQKKELTTLRISVFEELEHIRNKRALRDILNLVTEIRRLIEAGQY